ncbi:unnamed protein product [Ilex paraguariensis]|uniref:Zinc finger protein n=1 Tax=Ilex paraguariensis TaxID=185542 RepID=A0ABC8UUZ0_9AQUA
MGGGDPEKVTEPPVVAVGPFPGVRLVDAPILFFVLFHKAIRAELSELRRFVVEVSENVSRGRDLVVDLCRRVEFLKLVYNYHCAAEDEVIFLALDGHVKNVVCTYSLEHESIDELFDSIFNGLDLLMKKDEDIAKPFQEFVSCIGTIQTTICQHMLKEEEQVFPLLMQYFSSEEQGSLVWHFMCSVPIMLLEDFLPWMNSFLSPDERMDVIHCIKEVVPKEKLLQEVVISWVDSKDRDFYGAYGKYGKGGQFPDGLDSLKGTFKVHAPKSISGEECRLKKAHSIGETGRHNPIDGIHLWHDAIIKDLKEILEELFQIRTNSFSTLDSVIVQLKFFADVLIFYRYVLDNIFYPLWDELTKDFSSIFCEVFVDESRIEGLQKLLHYTAQSGIPISNFVEKLRGELVLFVRAIGKLLTYLETKVFPIISKNCNHEMQQWLLYKSLHMMPLGLLKCVITWFSTHLSEDESKSILCSFKQGGPLTNKYFASLLYEWACISYSGKTSVEKVRKDLRDMFISRASFLSAQNKKSSAFSYSQSYTQSRFNPGPSEKNAAINAMNCVSFASSSGSKNTWDYDISYSSRINLHIFFPQTLKELSPLSAIIGAGSFFNLESRPVDFIFFFHKSLKKELEYLVLRSSKLAENVGLLMDFHQRFNLVRFLYQIHSNSEDEIAFPALEAKGKLQNISHSYTIDHKFEVEHFNKVSLVLDEISGLHVSVPESDLDALDQRMLHYHQLCIKLHDLCKSMHKILIDHVHREEVELWHLFRECFSIEEQEKIIGCILGIIGAEILQEMIPWLMVSLTPEEQRSMMSLWCKTARNTMFEEWLGEWWEGMKISVMANVEEEPNISHPWTIDPLEVISTYLMKEDSDDQGRNLDNKGIESSQIDFAGHSINEPSRTLTKDDKVKVLSGDQNNHQSSDCTEFSEEVAKKRCNEIADVTDQANKIGKVVQVNQTFCHQEKFSMLSQEELEAAIRSVSRDSTLDPRKKSYLIQNLLTSRWFVTQQKLHPEVTVSSGKEEVPGQCPSYQDPLGLVFGCKHYKRNCKLVASCCNKLYTCIRCHDDMANHSMDRKTTTKMMCMKCMIIQPIGATCSTVSCNNISMARYYCQICKLFDDEREKCLEDNCPICHEYIFTSSSPVKALPCGHLMHSACFQDYTCTHYTCPICSKSLGDMQVYFGMLDAWLAEEKIPEEYSGQTQVILCNDCEKRGTASFHWLYHKCSYCGSYNTRVL